MLRRMGCELKVVRLPASLVLRAEPFKIFRFWSYVVTACATYFLRRRFPETDVVISVSDYFCDVIPALFMKRWQSGVQWIAWIHHREIAPRVRPGNRFANEITWRIQTWSFRRIARNADQAWVLDSEAGDEIATDLRAFGMPFEKIRKMRNGVDLSGIRQLHEVSPHVDAVMIGVRPNKGAGDIVPVWREVQLLRPGTTLLLMGGISDVESLAERLVRAGLSDVVKIFRPEEGWLAPKAFFAKIKEARVLFAPSHEEGWGIAVCEAMACGLPVVAYDLPVYHRVYGDSLVSVSEKDYHGFAEAICNLLDRPEQFALFQRRGCECAAKYDWDKVAADDWALLGIKKGL